MRKINKNFARRLASWFMVAMMVTLVGCGKDVPSTPDTTPDTPVVEADVDTNVEADTNVDVDVDVDANVDVETDVDVEPVAEPAKVIYEGLTPGGTGYYAMGDHDTFHTIGLFTSFVPIDKSNHAAFIAYVGDAIKDGGDYYAARWSSFDEVDIQLYTYSIENCKYAVYFEAPSDFESSLSYANDKAIGGFDIRASNSYFNDGNSITIRAFSMDYANGELAEYEPYNTPADLYIERGYEDVKDLAFEKEDGRYITITSRLAKDGNSRIFYGEFYDMSESKLVNMYSVKLQVSVDFSEEDALAIINSVRFMEKDEADELYMSLLKQTEANEYFDPATIIK